MRFGKSPTERSSIFCYAHIHPLPDEPCLVDLRLIDGSVLIGCRIETSFTVRKEVEIYYKTAMITEPEIVMWRYAV